MKLYRFIRNPLNSDYEKYAEYSHYKETGTLLSPHSKDDILCSADCTTHATSPLLYKRKFFFADLSDASRLYLNYLNDLRWFNESVVKKAKFGTFAFDVPNDLITPESCGIGKYKFTKYEPCLGIELLIDGKELGKTEIRQVNNMELGAHMYKRPKYYPQLYHQFDKRGLKMCDFEYDFPSLSQKMSSEQIGELSYAALEKAFNL